VNLRDANLCRAKLAVAASISSTSALVLDGSRYASPRTEKGANATLEPSFPLDHFLFMTWRWQLTGQAPSMRHLSTSQLASSLRSGAVNSRTRGARTVQVGRAPMPSQSRALYENVPNRPFA